MKVDSPSLMKRKLNMYLKFKKNSRAFERELSGVIGWIALTDLTMAFYHSVILLLQEPLVYKQVFICFPLGHPEVENYCLCFIIIFLSYFTHCLLPRDQNNLRKQGCMQSNFFSHAK